MIRQRGNLLMNFRTGVAGYYSGFFFYRQNVDRSDSMKADDLDQDTNVEIKPITRTQEQVRSTLCFVISPTLPSVWANHDDNESTASDTVGGEDSIPYSRRTAATSQTHTKPLTTTMQFHPRRLGGINRIHTTRLKNKIWCHSSLTRISATFKVIIWRTLSNIVWNNQRVIHWTPAYTPRMIGSEPWKEYYKKMFHQTIRVWGDWNVKGHDWRCYSSRHPQNILAVSNDTDTRTDNDYGYTHSTNKSMSPLLRFATPARGKRRGIS